MGSLLKLCCGGESRLQRAEMQAATVAQATQQCRCHSMISYAMYAYTSRSRGTSSDTGGIVHVKLKQKHQRHAMDGRSISQTAPDLACMTIDRSSVTLMKRLKCTLMACFAAASMGAAT